MTDTEMLDANKKLAALGAWIMDLRSNDYCGDIDGGDLQDKLLELGLLSTELRHEPCCEGCNCVGYGLDFPVECLVTPKYVSAAIRAAVAEQGGEK